MLRPSIRQALVLTAIVVTAEATGCGGDSEASAPRDEAGAGAAGTGATGGAATGGTSAAGSGGSGAVSGDSGSAEASPDAPPDAPALECSAEPTPITDQLPPAVRLRVDGTRAYTLGAELSSTLLLDGNVAPLWTPLAGNSFASRLEASGGEVFWTWQGGLRIEDAFEQSLWRLGIGDIGAVELIAIGEARFAALALAAADVVVVTMPPAAALPIDGASPDAHTIERLAKRGGERTILSVPDAPVVALAVGSTNVYFLAADAIWKISLASSGSEAPEPVTQAVGAGDVAVGPNEDAVYWTEPAAGRIQRLAPPTAAGTQKELTNQAPGAERLLIDSNNAYWKEIRTSTTLVRKVALSGGEPATVADDGDLVDYDIDANCAYWVSRRQSSERASLWRVSE